MSGNRYLLADKSRLLRKKLEALTSNLNGKLGNENLQTYEQYVAEAVRILDEFYKSLKEPALDKELIETVRVDNIPDSSIYNTLWQQVINDLITVFTELENIEDLSMANFNFITTEANRLTARLKAVDSKLGDYILYSLSPSKDVFFFKDSFNDLSKVDVNSKLLNTQECSVDQTEGIVTLPYSQGADSIIIIRELPVINPNSNGVVGNNQELGANYNGNMAVLLDNNPDTWFEYEKIITKTSEDRDPLVLDMTINLGSEQVINHIRVNPNNFGTKTIIQIDEIETSIDGQVYTSIKDDIPIAGFTTQDEENIFSLAPSTSKFAGQGLYTFTPRKARYIHFIFRQTEPYIITTAAGDRLRYAVGLRDIDIRGWTYNSDGELISTPFYSLREIRKVVLETNQNPTSLSDLASIRYFISPDDGGSWHEIQPKDFYGPIGVDAIPEVLDFNTGDADAIVTPVAVKSLRLKIVMKREDDAFEEGSSTFSKRIINTSELYEVPQGSPFSIELLRSPVDGTVVVVDPLFGSRGMEDAQYIIGHASDGMDMAKYRLPFKNFPRPVKKTWDAGSGFWYTEHVPASEYMHVEVGGEEWEQADQPLNDYVLDFRNPEDYKKYTFNPNNGILQFGDGFSNTLSPDEKQPVSVYFDAEQLFPSELEDIHLAKLDFPTSNNKDDFVLKRYAEIESYAETFPRKAMVIRLENQNIVSYTGITTAMTAAGFTVERTFVNGKEELTDPSHWSIDIDEGIVYTAVPTAATSDISVSYTYQPIYELTTDEWDWGTTEILRDSVSIRESAWQTMSVDNEELPTVSGTRVLDLSKLSVVKGTLSLQVTDDGDVVDITDDEHPFVKEVDYINGIEELGGQFLQTTQNIPKTVSTYSGNVKYFTLNENITSSSDYRVAFTNTTMFSNLEADREPANINAVGDYYVERDPASPNSDYRRVYFYSTTTDLTSPGKITYFFASSNFNNTGVYSVDYKLGKIYTQRQINVGTLFTQWGITASYQYTDYRAEYRIARLMPTESYKVDITNNTITFKDSEILKHLQTPHAGMDSRPPLYLVNYDYVDETREDITDLADKFTPVLKDYSLRILTKGSVI